MYPSEFLTIVVALVPSSLPAERENEVIGIREKVRTVKEIPNHMKTTVQLAITALAIAIAAFFMTLGVAFRAH